MYPYALMFFFFFNDTATTEIYTLSLHDALPISANHNILPPGYTIPLGYEWALPFRYLRIREMLTGAAGWCRDRKSTRLNSSHVEISYAVFCLKKKKKIKYIHAL